MQWYAESEANNIETDYAEMPRVVDAACSKACRRKRRARPRLGLPRRFSGQILASVKVVSEEVRVASAFWNTVIDGGK